MNRLVTQRKCCQENGVPCQSPAHAEIIDLAPGCQSRCAVCGRRKIWGSLRGSFRRKWRAMGWRWCGWGRNKPNYVPGSCPFIARTMQKAVRSRAIKTTIALNRRFSCPSQGLRATSELFADLNQVSLDITDFKELHIATVLYWPNENSTAGKQLARLF